jgi:hypothetical protein
MKAAGYDLTKILRAVNMKQQRGSGKQQEQEQASESRPKAAEDENGREEQEEPQDEEGTPSQTASLPKAAASLQPGGCYVCGRSSCDSGSIFVPMSNEGKDSCVAARRTFKHHVTSSSEDVFID